MTIEQILTAISFIGLGGVITSMVNYIIQNRKIKSDSKHSLKETRYKAIILLCYSYVNYDKEKMNLIINRPDIDSITRLYNELGAEWINMALYASDNVVLKMKDFITKKDNTSFNDLIITMRKDLYGIKTKLNSDSFKISNQITAICVSD